MEASATKRRRRRSGNASVHRLHLRLSHVVAVAYAAPRSPISVVANSTAVPWPRTDASSAGDSARTDRLDKVAPLKYYSPSRDHNNYCQTRISMRVVLRL